MSLRTMEQLFDRGVMPSFGCFRADEVQCSGWIEDRGQFLEENLFLLG